MSYANYQSRRVPGFISYLASLLRYRHLCWNLVGSDLRSRFRRSYLGPLWAIVQPLGYSLIIAWAWGAIFRSSDYLGFAIYVYSGMLVWEYFSNCINGSLEGLMAAVGYLRQARIPLFVFQLRIPLTGGVTAVCALAGLLLMMLVLGRFPAPGLHLLLVPASFAILVLFMTPIAIIFSIFGAQLRDLKHIMGLVLQLLFFLSPVMMVRDQLDRPALMILKFINPLVPLLDMLREPLLYGHYWAPTSVVTVAIWGATLWIIAGFTAVSAGRRVVFAI